MLDTSFTNLVGISVPLQLAAMPGIGTPALVAAVANAGALGMLGAPLMPPAELERVLEDIASRTSGVVGVNFLMPFLEPDCMTAAARHVRVMEFFYGDPDARLVGRAHELGAMVGWQVGSRAEALAAERAGCDFIVAQGTEAGGHVRGDTSLLPLLSEVLDHVKVPIVAAGGIATARGLAAVLACGCGAARLGTRFVASVESGAHSTYKHMLLEAGEGSTCLTEAYSVMWPNAPHRVLRAAIAAAERLEDEVIGEERAALGEDTMAFGEDRDAFGGNAARSALMIPRFSVIPPTATTTGHIEAMALYAGESVVTIDAIEPAAAIVAELAAGAERLLRRWRT